MISLLNTETQTTPSVLLFRSGVRYISHFSAVPRVVFFMSRVSFAAFIALMRRAAAPSAYY